MINLQPMIKELTQQRTHLDQAISILQSLGMGTNATGMKVGHRMSAVARKRISVAQKARWRTMRATKLKAKK
jgi:hypothetical protein